MLEIRNLTKVFYEDPKEQTGELLVLDNVSFSVPRNQFVCLLGPSGCGKTTLLRIVVGLNDADGGEVRVDGALVKGAGQDRCMVFQIFRSSSCRSSRVCISTAAKGSSMRRIFGSLESARARPVRCCMPPEIWCG